MEVYQHSETTLFHVISSSKNQYNGVWEDTVKSIDLALVARSITCFEKVACIGCLIYDEALANMQSTTTKKSEKQITRWQDINKSKHARTLLEPVRYIKDIEYNIKWYVKNINSSDL